MIHKLTQRPESGLSDCSCGKVFGYWDSDAAHKHITTENLLGSIPVIETKSDMRLQQRMEKALGYTFVKDFDGGRIGCHSSSPNKEVRIPLFAINLNAAWHFHGETYGDSQELLSAIWNMTSINAARTICKEFLKRKKKK